MNATSHPADEWLLDNFYVAQEQIRQVRDDLPRGFYRGLPKLAEGHLEGYPRVLGIAWAFVAHTDSRIDREVLLRFLAAYQRVQPLTIGELWAVAIALRIVLIENLRRAADQIAEARAARIEADMPGRPAARRRRQAGHFARDGFDAFQLQAITRGFCRAIDRAFARPGSTSHASSHVAG